MKKSQLLGAVCACIFTLVTTKVNAALIQGLSGQVVYDTDLNITWLADANLAVSNTFGVTDVPGNFTGGLMTWDTAQYNWLPAMNLAGGSGYLGYSNWRLPLISEMSHLYFTELNVTFGNSINTSAEPELAYFTPFGNFDYWSSEVGIHSFIRQTFRMNTGAVSGADKGAGLVYVIPVASGNPFGVSAIPIPAAFWLFCSGLLGLAGMARRKHPAMVRYGFRQWCDLPVQIESVQ